MMLFRILRILSTARAALHLWLFRRSSERTNIQRDVERWLEVTSFADSDGADWNGLVWLLWKFPEFRTLFYYRIKRQRGLATRLFLELAKLFYRPLDSLYLDVPSIGPGLFIQHGFSTIVAAESVGENCWINQQVTVGFANENDRPVIGNHVQITAGAKVIGRVRIGDHSIVGANAVVVKDVPPHCTVVGVPAYIVKQDGVKVRKDL